MVFKRDMTRTGGGSRERRSSVCGVGVLTLILAIAANDARAETIGGALMKAYLNNPDINQQRAAVRVADENIPKANAGYLPTASAQANAGVSNTQGSGLGTPQELNETSLPRGYGVTVSETLFNGNRTFNSVRQAESATLGARETLRNTEQTALLNGLTYYMNVLRDTATLDLDRSQVQVLQEQLRQTRDRFNVGEVTRTDVAQAESVLAGAQSTALTAQSNLQTSIANYRQIIGDEPRSLAPVAPIVGALPRTLPEAIAISQVEHPLIVAALHGVDSAELAIKINEGALYPTVGLQASLTKAFDSQTSLTPGSQILTGSILGQVNVPIYDGGATYANIRQSKEQLGQQELATDLQRDIVRAQVVSAWGQNTNSTGVLRAARAQVDSAQVALAGVREEAKVGQRTTLDVLNAQQTLLSARVQLVNAQHDQVVNSYALLSAIGRLSIRRLGISVAEYDPRVHFDQVKTKQFGVRTPDGK